MLSNNNIKEQFNEFIEARKENVKVIDVEIKNDGNPDVIIQCELQN